MRRVGCIWLSLLLCLVGPAAGVRTPKPLQIYAVDVEGGQATLLPDWEKSYGQPVYLGPDGSLYVLDANGNPVPYSSQAAAPRRFRPWRA